MPNFEVDISYTQIAVFHPTMAKPFNDWTDEHVAQGFAWRPGSVSFGTLQSGGKAKVIVTLLGDESFQLKGDAVRAIEVPFAIDSKNVVEVGSIASGQH